VEVSKEDDAPMGRSSNGCKHEDAGREKCRAGTCIATAATSIATPPSPLAALPSLLAAPSLSLLAYSNQDNIPYFSRGQIGILGFEEAQFRLALFCMVKTIYCCFTVTMW
jgi:hypothetical protein